MIWGKLCLRWCQCLFLVSSLLGGGVHGMTEESLRSALDKAGQFLKGTSVTAEDLKMLGTKLDSLGTEVEGLRTLQTQVKAKEAEIDRLVAMANVKQIESFVTRLSDTMAKEMNLRALGNSASTGGGSEARVLVEGGDFVTMRELKNSFVAGDLLEPSEKILQSWVASLITEELEAFAAGVKVPEIGTSVEAEEKTSTTVCPSALEVVQDVQMALTRYSQDGIGLVDHLQGAQIVHSMTSPTYTPPASETDLLGNVWWRRFIPEDWEDFLPLGWEDWDTRIPSTIQHTLNLNGASTAPPETILQPKTIAGSCWPMAGSTGHVTMRLPYHIQVETFSVDHVPWQIVPENMFESAPKTLKVLAYPPCEEPEYCGALGFDFDDPMEIGQINYDADGPDIQTFDSVFVQASKNAAALKEEEEGSLDIGGGDGESCSQEAAACSTPPRIHVAAITLKIVENHGNPDFTCIYRFRVHGEQVI